MIFESINPYDGEVFGFHKGDSKADIDAKILKSQQAFEKWRELSFEIRGTLFLHLAAHLRGKKEELASIITKEMGKILAESRSEIEKCAVQCEYFARHSENLLQPNLIQTEANESYINFEPLGIIFGIMPWNFPFWQVFRYAVPALMAGNTTLLKHAPNVFGCAKAIENAFRAVGFDEGVLQNLICGVPMVEKIIAHPKVAMVTLTGSERAGAAVASLAGKNIKKIVLELGGSDAFIVMPDADLGKAANAAVASRMMNAGQVCIAAKRFFVHQSVKSEFISLFKQKIEALKLGNPTEPETNVGPLARIDLADQCTLQVRKGIEQGAKVWIEPQQKDCFFSPTLVEILETDNVLFQEETFGPVAVVKEFQQKIDLIKWANESNYGLSAAIWSANLEEAKALGKQLEVGSVFINAVVKSDSRLPIGGLKRSGFGRELSEIGIKEYCNAKVIYVS